MAENTLMIIDSHALIYRAYYAFPPTLTTSDGMVVNAAYGFTSLLLDVVNKFQPSNIIAVLDSGEPIERQAAFTQYKANRSAADDIMIKQIPLIEEILQTFGIPIFKISGIEADDIIATIDHQFAEDFDKTIIVTGDQDLFQLVDEDTFIYLAGRRFSESKLYDEEMVFEKLGIRPVQIPDYKSLAGDNSDNIPGVRGIGPKTACELISKYHSLEGVYTNINDVNSKAQNKLIENQEIAFLSKSLATVNREVPVSIDINESKFNNVNVEMVRDLFARLQFKAIITKLDKLIKLYGVQQMNMDLFSTPSIAPKEIMEWEGDELDGNSVCIQGIFENIEKDPLHWVLEKVYFVHNDKVLFTSNIKEFINKNLSKEFICFDSKKWIHVISNMEMDCKCKFFDLGMAGVILSGGRANNTLSSVFHFFGLNYSDNTESNIGQLSLLKSRIDEKFISDRKLEFLYQLEFKILSIVVEMERNGVTLDVEFYNKLEIEMQKDKESLQKQIYENAGHEFNIGSPKQVGEILFVEKSLPVSKKTKSGAFSTDERTLRDLVGIDPIVENILKYRELDKILNTYVKALPLYVNPDTKKVHSVFDQLGAISGRFSSKNPNMQNIPKGEVLGVDIRDGFIASEDSYFISFDYSQQELRILAALSGEEVMIDSFNNDKDIHRITATEIFNVTEDEVDSLKRDQGKTINFSIIYGISAFGLSDRMKISRDQAALFISRYFEKYKKVKGFMDEVLEGARKNGYVETVLGRRRYSQTINSNNRNLRSAAERELFNLVIQGTAADIMKLCMTSFEDVCKKYPAKLLMQIHDEFLFEFKTNDPSSDTVINFIEEIKEIMISVYDLGVKYKVESSIGKRWGEMVKV